MTLTPASSLALPSSISVAPTMSRKYTWLAPGFSAGVSKSS